MAKKNMLICQSGGPTVVINQSLVGAVLEAKKSAKIGKIIGARNAIKGLLDEDFVNLGKESESTLEAVAKTPSSALGTARKKANDDDCHEMFEIMKRNNVGYFFCIGGNDSAENAYIVNKYSEEAGIDICCYHIPKTIDNDLRENDHTPGFGSAGKFVAQALMGDNLDNRALPGVKIDVIMGRHAGFLTAASALGRKYPDDGPHLIYLPERAFSITRFVADVKRVYKKHGRCLIAVSEGISDRQGVAIAAKFSKEVDSHGNVQLSGTGALGDLLAGIVKEKTSITRVRADTFGYLQRSFPGVVSERDAKEARAVGVAAVKRATAESSDGSIAIKRKPGKGYKISLERVDLKKVARNTREVPASHINKAGNDVTKAFINYATPIVGDLAPIGRLKAIQL